MGRQTALNAAMYGYEAAVDGLKAEACGGVVKWAGGYVEGCADKAKRTAAGARKMPGLPLR